MQKRIRFFMITVMIILLVSCSLVLSDNGTRLDSPQNVHYVNNILTWSYVENASGYKLNINGNQYFTTSCHFDFSSIFFVDTDFSYSIIAVSGTDKLKDSKPSLTRTAKYVEETKKRYSDEIRNYGLGRAVNLITGSYISIYAKGADVFNKTALAEKDVNAIRLRRNRQIVQYGETLDSFQQSQAKNFATKLSVCSIVDEIKNLLIPWQQSSLIDAKLNNGYKKLNSKDTCFVFYTITNKWEEVEYSFDGWNGWSVTEIEGMLSESFKSDAMEVQNGTMSAASFVNRYGTHLMMGCILGASLNVNYSLVGLDIGVQEVDYDSASMGFSIPVNPTEMNSLHLGVSESRIKSILNGTKYLNVNSEIYSVGGSSPFHRKMGELFDFKAFSTAYWDWAESISDKNSYALVDVVDGSLVCVWDLLSDDYTVAKSKLNQYFEDCIIDSYNVAKGKIDDLVDDSKPRFEDGTPDHPWRIGDIVSLHERLETYNDSDLNNFLLVNDIDMTGATWNYTGDFKGVLNGAKETGGGCYSIYNMDLSTNNNKSGLFRSCSGTIKNIDFSNCKISNSVTGQDAITGIIAGELTGKILNCSVINSAVICTASDKNDTENSSRWSIAGGIVGKVSGGSVMECTIIGLSITASSNKHDRGWSTGWNEAAYVYAGGVAGEVVSGTISGNSIVSIAKIHGNANYRTNTFWPVVAGVFSRVCLGGVVGRQARDGVLYALNSTVSSCSLFESKFNSYNDTYRVDAHEDGYTNVGIGLTD